MSYALTPSLLLLRQARLASSQEVEVSGALARLLWEQQQGLIRKGAGHKYIRRVPYINAKGKRRYRYYYKVSGGKGLAHEEELVVGAAFKIKSGVKEGHFHITKVEGDKVTVEHDESGHTQTMTREHLAAMLRRYHAEAIADHKASTLKNLDDAKKHGSQKQQQRMKERALQYGYVGDSPPEEEVGLYAEDLTKDVRSRLKVEAKYAFLERAKVHSTFVDVSQYDATFSSSIAKTKLAKDAAKGKKGIDGLWSAIGIFEDALKRSGEIGDVGRAMEVLFSQFDDSTLEAFDKSDNIRLVAKRIGEVMGQNIFDHVAKQTPPPSVAKPEPTKEEVESLKTQLDEPIELKLPELPSNTIKVKTVSMGNDLPVYERRAELSRILLRHLDRENNHYRKVFKNQNVGDVIDAMRNGQWNAKLMVLAVLSSDGKHADGGILGRNVDFKNPDMVHLEKQAKEIHKKIIRALGIKPKVEKHVKGEGSGRRAALNSKNLLSYINSGFYRMSDYEDILRSYREELDEVEVVDDPILKAFNLLRLRRGLQ